MPFPLPLKSSQLSPSQKRALYAERLEDDVRLADNSVITIADNLFDNANQSNVIQPFANQTLDLSQDFWNFRPINGLQSLKRGFFRIISTPEQRNLAGVMTWSAYVFYNAGKDLNTHYLYYANVGTMVNRYAVAFDLSTRSFINMPFVDGKSDFLNGMKDKTFYVSRAEFVQDEDFGQMKEVLWFKL